MKKNGMLVALLDEYRRATIDLKKILNKIPQDLFTKILDPNTDDPDCKSIQSVTTHLIQSGHTYSNYINAESGLKWLEYCEQIETPMIGIAEIDKLLDFVEQSFGLIWHKTNEELEKWKIETRWNVTYDFEQLMEHAIVHILRHRRQIENFIKSNE